MVVTVHCMRFFTGILLLRAGCYSTPSIYFKESTCNANEVASNMCASVVDNPRGTTECAARCVKESDCIGVARDGQGRCLLQRVCGGVSVSDCVSMEPNPTSSSVLYLCANGSVWDSANKRCQCVGGLSGPACQIYPRQCNDLLALGMTHDVYRTTLDLYGDGSFLFPVFCRTYSSWGHILALINSGEKDFNKTWAEYRDGFYLDDSHYWIGLKNMHTLFTMGLFRQLWVQVYYKVGRELNRKYFNVQMADGNRGYSLSYGISATVSLTPSTEKLLDCWEGLIHAPFSTWDRDNDGDVNNNCAASAGSGWRYSGCNPPCNLLGRGANYSSSMPKASLINLRLRGIDMDALADNITVIHIGVF